MLRCTRTPGTVPAVECLEMLRYKPIKGEPPTSGSKSPSAGAQPPRTQDEPPKTRSGTPYSSAEMLGNVKVSRYEQRANREKKHIEARENSIMKRERTKRKPV